MVPVKSSGYDYAYYYETDPNPVPPTDGAQANGVSRGSCEVDVVQPAEVGSTGAVSSARGRHR